MDNSIIGLLIINTEKDVVFQREDWISADNAFKVYFARKGFVVEDYFGTNQHRRYYILEKHNIRIIPIEDPTENNICKISIVGECSSISFMLDILKDILTMFENRFMIINGKLLMCDKVVSVIDNKITTTTVQLFV